MEKLQWLDCAHRIPLAALVLGAVLGSRKGVSWCILCEVKDLASMSYAIFMVHP